MPALVALVKHVPDTWSAKSLDTDYTLDRASADEIIDEINEYSVEQALRIKEAHPEEGFRVVALTMGTERAEECLRKALSMGADEAVLLHDDNLAGSDAMGTAWALHNAINTIDDVALIITGNASSDGQMGMIPGILAEYRQIPALTNVASVSINVDASTVHATRGDHQGSYELSASYPAVVSVTERADTPRFPNFKGIMAAKKAEITRLDLAAIGVDPAQVGLRHAATAVTNAIARPGRSQGEIVYDNGDGGTRIADYLESAGLL